MICNNCNKVNPDNAKFCVYCGAPLSPGASNNKNDVVNIFIASAITMLLLVMAAILLFFVISNKKSAGSKPNISGGGGGGGGAASMASMTPENVEPSSLEIVTEAPNTRIIYEAKQDKQEEDNNYDAYYIIPGSSKRYLSRNELDTFTDDELKIARNEIYARHGRKFKDSSLQSYFNSCPWYNGTINSDAFDASLLNNYEKENIELITMIEEERNTNSSENNSYYVLIDSDSRYLTRKDLDPLTKDELRIARNEIYARHGRKFKDSSLQSYFNSCPWYNGTIDPDDFDTSVFNKYEMANKDFIAEYEKGR